MNDKHIGMYWYKVRDTGHGVTYTVDLSSTDNPCSCHQPKWQKVPCIHVIQVLSWKEEYSRVWDYVGKEYTLGEVEATCDYLTDEEFNFMVWIHNMIPELTKGRAFSRSYRANNGRNTPRIPSKGDLPVANLVMSNA